MKIPLLLMLVAVTAALSVLLGRDVADLGALFGQGDAVEYWRYIIFELRLPRVLMAILIGAMLASSGLLFQSTLHNPLASPFTLGSSAGAALGAYIAYLVFGPGSQGVFIGFAFGLALLVSLPIYLLAARRRVPPEAVLLAGVAITFGTSAVISGLTYVASEKTIFAYARWSLGDLSVIGYDNILILLVPTLLPVIYGWLARHRLDAMAGGEELALARGVNIAAVRSGALLVVTIGVGASVALCGPIAFIGLIVPHVARAIYGGGHSRLTIAAPLLGAILLMLCDFAGRNILTVDIPIGVMTAALGTPAFIALLVTRLGRARG
ncbi:MAG: iron ABC transporter permease [Planctomycetes bacterium]|nr:iron ABC transporter permease [Planctomycetota bacterium]